MAFEDSQLSEGLSTVASPSIHEISPALCSGLKHQTKRLFVDAAYSGRGHLESCGRWQKWDTVLGIPATVLSSLLAAGAAVSALLETAPMQTAVLAGAAAVLNGLRSFLQPDIRAQAHGLKGNQYLSIRDDARMFLEVDLRSRLITEQDLVDAIKELRRRYTQLKHSDPQLIPRRDYEAAKRNIEAGESSYLDDPLWQELDD